MEIKPLPHQKLFLECNGTEDKEPIRIVFFGGGGGGGKTWSILLDNLLGVHDPDYYSVFFRSTNNELETNLWPAAKKMYHKFLFKDEEGKQPIGKAHINEQKMVITFPSGAKSKFSYLEYDKHADSWYGAELCKIYIDELQMHSEYAFHVLRSRNRSVAKVAKGMRFTLNPDPTHWMFEWIEPFLKDDGSGFPNPDNSARVRYYLIISGKLHTSWDKQELIDRFGKNPQTYTYIPATLKDNTILQEIDPDYYSMLDSLPEDKRDQLLLGCWKDNGDRGVYWKREWLQKADNLPEGRLLTARGYDLAGSEPSLNYKCPDFTVGIKMSKDEEGRFYIWGDYIPSFKNEDSNIEGRVWRNIGERDKLIADQAAHDGAIPIILPQDAGSAGKEAFENKVKYFMELGVVVKKDNATMTQKKLTKAEPFFQACQHEMVYILEHTFNIETLDWLYGELERFVGERSGNSVNSKDDAVDACATVFNYLAQSKVYRTPVIPNLSKYKTLSSELLTSRGL